MDLIYFATFLIALLSSFLSGLAGGGGSFIMAPYWLVAGMTPAQGATTGAFMALGMGSSSLAAYKGSEHIPNEKKSIAVLLIISLLASAVGPCFLQHTDINTYKPVLVVITLASLPFLFIDRSKLIFSSRNKIIGYIIMALLLLLSSFITSSAFSILMAVVLMQTFGWTTLESTAVRRCIGIIQSIVIFAVLCSLGNFILLHAIMALGGGSLGSYIGTRISLKRGEKFAKYALAVGAIISTLTLLA